ncbi:transcriptional regulator [Chromatiales bacterium (ex Bugula neritina AB1)]|nr:transcriptional regulator [Chromatiales bacterium (ex Bugula neritina AB1)]
MVEQKDERLSRTLKAISDSTRREIITDLIQQGPTRVTDLASCYSISLNAVSKHIKVLENAELVTRTTHGRIHLIEATTGPVTEIEQWLSKLNSIWALRLDKLSRQLGEFDD